MKKQLIVFVLILAVSAANNNQNEGGLQKCIKQKCPNQFATCPKDDKCVLALQKCNKKCGNNPECWNICLQIYENQNATAFHTCVQSNKCESVKVDNTVTIDNPKQCAELKCPHQQASCLRDSQCISTLSDCNKKCGSKAQCWNLCLNQQNNKIAIDFKKCLKVNRCDQLKPKGETIITNRQQCIEQNCPKELLSCQNDSKCEVTLNKCISKCDGNIYCWWNCLAHQKNQNAIKIADCSAAYLCDQRKAKHSFISCMQKSCYSPQFQCLYDKECSSMIHKCQKNGFSYDKECLLAQKKNSKVFNLWLRCAVDNYCF